MTERTDKLKILQLDEARATGALVAIARTMLIYHANGGETPELWARLSKAYDAYDACSRALIDGMCEAFEQVRDEPEIIKIKVPGGTIEIG